MNLVNNTYQDFFNFMSNEHGLTLTISEMDEIIKEAKKLEGKINKSNVITPNQLEPILAEIEHINDLGKSKWNEVVYFDKKWCSYGGSNTFNDGERVVKWKYVKNCL